MEFVECAGQCFLGDVFRVRQMPAKPRPEHLDQPRPVALRKLLVCIRATPYGAPNQLIRFESRSPTNFWSIISKLSERHPTKIVGHFKKIGMLVPYSLTVTPVFQELSESKSWMPVVVEGKEWLRCDMASITERLAKSDGIMLIVGLNSSALQGQLQAMSQRSVPGFSEEGGFLGWCWPSQWHAIGQRLNDIELRALMDTSIQGVIYPWCGSKWAHVVPELSHEMHDLGFA